MADENVKSAAAIWILRGKEEGPDETRDSLMAAATRVWPKAEAHARLEMQSSSLVDDSSVVSEIWEASLQSALKSLKDPVRLRPVHDLDAYVFGIFRHRLKKRLGRERRLEFVASGAELMRLRAAQDWKWPDGLADRVLLQKAISEMDDWMKEVLFRRVIDEASWGEVASPLGLSERVTMKRFLYRLKKLRDRLSEAEKSNTTDA
jgi:DNA-directed RNA polymerase specialized sigma24 family protein